MYRYTKERNINELYHNSIYEYENNRNSPVYRYTRTAPLIMTSSHVLTLKHVSTTYVAEDMIGA